MIVFVSTRDAPDVVPVLPAMEIYVMNPDGSDPRRLTKNMHADVGPALSPDGRLIVFDSNRLRVASEPLNTSDLFVMDSVGENLVHFGRGGSATWSPDGRRIAFHASASGTGRPIRGDPGAAAADSDIFIVNVSDGARAPERRTNLTNSPRTVDEDPDWSPDGRRIVFTSHNANEANQQNPLSTEVWVINADGSNLTRLTYNAEEERAPTWSRDGTRILYVCGRGAAARNSTAPTGELCVLNADGSGGVQLTTNSVSELTPHWSVDGQRIVFHKAVRDPDEPRAQNELFQINADGSGEIRLTDTAGQNRFGNPGLMRQRTVAR